MRKNHFTSILYGYWGFNVYYSIFQINRYGNVRITNFSVLFSTVLIFTSRFEVKGSEIYMKRSKAFPVILISLLVIRTIIKIFISNEINPGEIAGMFFLLAFCMIVPWRLAMFYKYKKLKNH